MRDFVALSAKRHRGWPWPEKSWGRTPMYGADGWCRACGIPSRPQCGPLTLQRSGLTVSGAWTPYWVYGTICLASELAEQVAARFRVDLRDVAWPKTSAGDVRQVVVPVVGERWFDPDELERRATARHGRAGAICQECGVWRWMPLGFAPVPQLGSEVLPAVLHVPELDDVDVAASPEWFGDGGTLFPRDSGASRVRRDVLKQPARLPAWSNPSGCRVAPTGSLGESRSDSRYGRCGADHRHCCLRIVDGRPFTTSSVRRSASRVLRDGIWTRRGSTA